MDSMFLNLTESEMINLWKTVMHLEQVRRDCVIERDDGIDIDELLRIHLRQWYAHLLLTAPLCQVPIDDVKSEVTLSTDGQGVVTATLPERAVRPVEFKLQEWTRSVTRFLEPSSPEARLQSSPYTRGGICQPAAVAISPGRLLLMSAPSLAPQLELASCVARPADGSYRLSQAALSTIPDWERAHPSLL